MKATIFALILYFVCYCVAWTLKFKSEKMPQDSLFESYLQFSDEDYLFTSSKTANIDRNNAYRPYALSICDLEDIPERAILEYYVKDVVIKSKEYVDRLDRIKNLLKSNQDSGAGILYLIVTILYLEVVFASVSSALVGRTATLVGGLVILFLFLASVVVIRAITDKYSRLDYYFGETYNSFKSCFYSMSEKERRIESTGESVVEENQLNFYVIRRHFDSLIQLEQVIEKRIQWRRVSKNLFFCLNYPSFIVFLVAFAIDLLL